VLLNALPTANPPGLCRYYLCYKGVYQRRLANPCLASHKHHLAQALQGCGIPLMQLPQLGVALY